MALFLKAILAICLLVERVSANPLRVSEEKFKRNVSNLKIAITSACGNFKKSPCGNKDMQEIRFEYNEGRICQTYKKVFWDVHCALEEFSRYTSSPCNKTVSVMQPHSNLYDNKVNCTLPGRVYVLTKDFCPVLLNYVEALLALCVKY